MNKIAVLLSGGVDSSVAALLLKQRGDCDLIGIYMQNWHDTEGTLHGDCEWEEEKTLAEMVAKKIGIPFHFVDLSDIYRKRVVDYMFDEYEHGRTPNPDVLCNREIKFDAFLQEAIAVFEATENIDLVASVPCDWDATKAYDTTKDILTAHPDLKGIFACNDVMALAAVVQVLKTIPSTSNRHILPTIIPSG